ncbi:MAG: outer membrane protein assembly factor BamA [Candidatus Symbiothrix sp.]|nr:outer membrane protein assembly factor BamA [Candidatus Symbiothrix sp.]
MQHIYGLRIKSAMTLVLLFVGATLAVAQLAVTQPLAVTQNDVPEITYDLRNVKQYGIAGIKVSGVESYGYQDYVLIGISGLAVGEKVRVPGDEIAAAEKAFWKTGLFSDVTILATKLTADSVWLSVELKPNPIISSIQFHGLSKSEREDLEGSIGVFRGLQMTPNILNRTRKRTKEYFDKKSFTNADITIQQKPDVSNPGKIILDITVDKKEKVKIDHIYIAGNDSLKSSELKVAMKKTNEPVFGRKVSLNEFRHKWLRSTKFNRDDYTEDLNNIITKYNEKGYRDARIVVDSVVPILNKHGESAKKVDLYVTVNEGHKYFLRDVTWIGNTIYPTDGLSRVLDMKAGDVYNQKKLNDKLISDDEAVANLYYNQGYIFSYPDAVEVQIDNDSIDLEIRITEGVQATINQVVINGNDRVYEDVIRRELTTKPGQLYSKDAVMESLRGLAQMKHFDMESDPANMIQQVPDQQNGTMDITYNLTSKASDQVEFSAGWGQTGVVGRISLVFNNFSFKNLVHPSMYKGVIPQGEGQTMTLSGQTNGRYYQSYSVSFMEPWLGGKRPNGLSVSAFYMIQTGMESRSYMSPYGGYGGYGYGSGYGYGNYGYGSGYGSGYGYGDVAYDEDKSMKIFGFSVGHSRRLSWPDMYFTLSAELAYQRYMMNNWQYFVVQNGNSNELSLGLTLGRSSIDNPLYTRSGSAFSLSVNATPPYSLFDNKEYGSMSKMDPEMFKWIEYYKVKFKGKLFIPLTKLPMNNGPKRTPVLMSRFEYGFLNSYNSKKYNPFQTFYMGGDGMSGYSSMYANETIGLRGYEGGSLTPNQDGYAYTRIGMELRYPFMLEQSATIYGLVFAEAGNAWSEVKHFNPFDLKRSAGVGVRIFLPMVGLMGLDWAYGFDRPTPSDKISGSQIHFVLGQEF